jgi:hypothetical protein
MKKPFVLLVVHMKDFLPQLSPPNSLGKMPPLCVPHKRYKRCKTGGRQVKEVLTR